MNIHTLLLSTASRFWNFLWPPKPIPPLPLLPVEVTPAPVARKKRTKVDLDAVEETGRFYFKDAILDQLDMYFFYITRMRKADPEAYDLFNKIGASLLSRRTRILSNAPLSRWRSDISARPGFGATCFVGDEKDEIELAGKNSDKELIIKFLYFQKLKSVPSWVAPTHGDGDVYRVNAYIDSEPGSKYKRGHALICHVSVDKTGKVSMLMEKHIKSFSVKHNKGPKSQRGWDTIRTPVWDIPSWMYFTTRKDKKRIDHSQVAIDLFCMAVNSFDQAQWDMKVRVEKDNHVATFSIDMLRTPYFFSDRDASFNEAGNKKRIIHLVRTHERITAGGASTHVHSHFRGERKFTWNGYQVNVTMPGLHHPDLLEFDVGGLIPEKDMKLDPKVWIRTKELSEKLDRILNV